MKRPRRPAETDLLGAARFNRARTAYRGSSYWLGDTDRAQLARQLEVCGADTQCDKPERSNPNILRAALSPIRTNRPLRDKAAPVSRPRRALTVKDAAEAAPAAVDRGRKCRDLFGLGVGNLVSLPPLIMQKEFAAADVGKAVALMVAVTEAVLAFAPAVFGAVRDIASGYFWSFAL